jgi:hypothetical protein
MAREVSNIAARQICKDVLATGSGQRLDRTGGGGSSSLRQQILRLHFSSAAIEPSSTSGVVGIRKTNTSGFSAIFFCSVAAHC